MTPIDGGQFSQEGTPVTHEQPTFTAPEVGVEGCGSCKGDLDKALKMPTIDTVTGNRPE